MVSVRFEDVVQSCSFSIPALYKHNPPRVINSNSLNMQAIHIIKWCPSDMKMLFNPVHSAFLPFSLLKLSPSTQLD